MSKVKRKTKATKPVTERAPKDPKMQEKYAKLQADLYLVQGWFIRASWKNKSEFIIKAIRSINNMATLRSIVQAINPITKDISYSGAQTTKYSCDIVPNDDDRCLEETVKNECIEIDLKWINSLFDESDKLNILLHLIKIGGTELANLALIEANKLENILDFIIDLHTRYIKKDPLKLKYTTHLAKLISKALAKNPNILPLIDEYKIYSSLGQQKALNKYDKHSKNGGRNSKVFTNSLKHLKNKQNLWDKELKKLIHMARIGLPERTKVLAGHKSDVDKLQSLPLWINRQIVNLLDDESKSNLAKVNRYWRYTIDEVERENSVRQNLDDIIRKMETHIMSMKLPGPSFLASAKRQRQPAKSVESRKTNRELNRTLSEELEGLLRKNEDFKESVYKFVKKIPSKQIPFNGLYNDMIIRTIYMYDRAIDCNRRWIAATENTFIRFYNIITGAKTPFVLSGHSLVVTCVAFFPKSLCIVSGSLDKTVRTWNLWNREVIEIFEGHKDVVISVSANEEYVVSCGRDNEVRVFKQLSGGICIQMLNDTDWTPTMVTLSEDNIVYWSTREGAIKMFSITDKNINKSIDFAHRSDVINIVKYEKLIVTIGNDNYVRIWNPNFQYDTFITEFLHEKHINSVVITCLTLITACIDGALRFWHIGTGLLFRKIQINFSDMAMISLKCQEFYNHVKIICNNEANIYVLEFRMKGVKHITKKNLYRDISLHPVAARKKITPSARRLYKIHTSKCTLPQFRKRENYKKYTYSTEAIIKKAIIEQSVCEIFPRFVQSDLSEADT